MQQASVRSSRADLKVHLDNLHQLYNSTNEEVFSRLGLLSPPSKRPETHKTMYPTSPLIAAASLMKEEKDPAPRQFTRPRPTGNLFFYRPQSEARTPQEQAQLASGPLSTPDSPSMVCSGNSEIEEDDGWSCHKKEKGHESFLETIQSGRGGLLNEQQENPLKVVDDFPFPVPSQNSNKNKKDTAALDLILKKAAVFLSPLPQEKENEDREELKDDVVEEQEEVTPEEVQPIVPRCLAFDEEEFSPDKNVEGKEQEVHQQQRNVHPAWQTPPQQAAAVNEASVVTQNADNTSALNRLKQKTLERQSSHVAAFTKLKQLTVQKQKRRMAAAAATSMRPLSAVTTTSGNDAGFSSKISSKYNGSNSNSILSVEVNCFQSPMPPSPSALPQPCPPPPAAFQEPSGAVDITTENKRRPRTGATAIPSAAAVAIAPEKDAATSGKKPYLKRRSHAVPMLHQGVPDWSAVKPKTQSKLDSNLILRQNSKGKSSASVARPGQGQTRRNVGATTTSGRNGLPSGITIETMEQYTANYHQNNTGGVNNRGAVGRAPTRPSSAPNVASAPGPLAQGTGRPLPPTAQQRAALRAKPFDPTSNTIAPAVSNNSTTRVNSFGPLGAAAIAASDSNYIYTGAGTAGAGFSQRHHQMMMHHHHSQYSTTPAHSREMSNNHEIGSLEDPLRPLLSQVDQLLNSVGRAIRR